MDEMDKSCKVAKNVAPLKSHSKPTDEVVNQILQQVIHCGCFIKSYCEDKSFGVFSRLKFFCSSLIVSALASTVIRTLKNLKCNAAEQIQSYKHALADFRARLQGNVTIQIGIQILGMAGDMAEVLKKLKEAGEISYPLPNPNRV